RIREFPLDDIIVIQLSKELQLAEAPTDLLDIVEWLNELLYSDTRIRYVGIIPEKHHSAVAAASVEFPLGISSNYAVRNEEIEVIIFADLHEVIRYHHCPRIRTRC
ncbi:hypothetical protein PFISCL1PPCAC_16950, partial [Pristionchus fissidentatus]